MLIFNVGVTLIVSKQQMLQKIVCATDTKREAQTHISEIDREAQTCVSLDQRETQICVSLAQHETCVLTPRHEVRISL